MTTLTIEKKLKAFLRGFGAKLCSQDMLLITDVLIFNLPFKVFKVSYLLLFFQIHSIE